MPFIPRSHTQLSVKFRGWGVIRDVAQPVIIPPQLRGLVFFSHSLYTLQHLYDKKVWQILFFFNVKATIFYTCKTDFFQIPGHWDVGCSPCVSFSDCEGLCQCLHVRLHTCPCIHNLLQSVSYFNTTECSSYTQRGREPSLSLNASSWSNGTTYDYNCQEWQLDKRTKTWPNSQTNYFTV